MTIAGKKYLCWLWLKILLLWPLFCQQTSSVRFDHLTVDDGLSENAVTCIIQDRFGYMWIGTHDGLNKYDGYHFTVFRNRPNDPNSLSDNAISAICEDNDGMIWVGTMGGGLNRLDPYTGSVTRYMIDSPSPRNINNNVVHHVFFDSRSRLLVSTPTGVNVYNQQGDRVFTIKVPEGTIFEDRAGTIWLIVLRGYTYRLDESSRSFKPYIPPMLRDLLENRKDANSPLWSG